MYAFEKLPKMDALKKLCLQKVVKKQPVKDSKQKGEEFEVNPNINLCALIGQHDSFKFPSKPSFQDRKDFCHVISKIEKTVTTQIF